MTPTHATFTRRSLLQAAGLGALALPVLAACGGGPSSSSAPADTRSGAARSLGSVNLPAPSLGLLYNAPLQIALVRGFFDEAGLTVQLADVVGTDVIRSIQGQSAVGNPGALPSIVAFSKGLKELRMLAPTYSGAENTFIAPTGGKVKSFADLRKGMKIGGAVPATPPNYFADALIRKAGLGPSRDVEIVSLGRAPDAWTAAKNGLVDVTWSNPPLDTQLIASGEAVRVALASEFAPAWMDNVLTTTQAKLDSQGDQVAAVVAGVAKAHALLRDDPEVAAAAWAKGAKIDPAVALAAIKDTPATAWNAKINRTAVEACAEAARTLGSVSGDVDLDLLLSSAST